MTQNCVLHACPVYIDASIVTPVAKSYADRASRIFKPGLIAEQQAAVKHSKYDLAVQRVGGEMVPFIMEVFGSFGKEACGLTRRLVSQLVKWDPSRRVQEEMKRVVPAIAMRMIRGSVRPIERGLVLASSKQ